MVEIPFPSCDKNRRYGHIATTTLAVFFTYVIHESCARDLVASATMAV